MYVHFSLLNIRYVYKQIILSSLQSGDRTRSECTVRREKVAPHTVRDWVHHIEEGGTLASDSCHPRNRNCLTSVLNFSSCCPNRSRLPCSKFGRISCGDLCTCICKGCHPHSSQHCFDGNKTSSASVTAITYNSIG